MRKHIWSGVISLLIMIAGLWLMQAPFAFGYQQGGADWTASTKWDFWIGLGLAVVSLLGVLLFAQSAVAELRRLGIVRPRPVAKPAPVVPVDAPAQRTPATATTDLEGVLLPMVTALLADMAERRNAAGAAIASGTSNNNAGATTVATYTTRPEGEGR